MPALVDAEVYASSAGASASDRSLATNGAFYRQYAFESASVAAGAAADPDTCHLECVLRSDNRCAFYVTIDDVCYLGDLSLTSGGIMTSGSDDRVAYIMQGTVHERYRR